MIEANLKSGVYILSFIYSSIFFIEFSEKCLNFDLELISTLFVIFSMKSDSERINIF